MSRRTVRYAFLGQVFLHRFFVFLLWVALVSAIFSVEHKAVCWTLTHATLTMLERRQGKLFRPCYLGPSPPSWDRFLTYMAHTMSASSRRAIQVILLA